MIDLIDAFTEAWRRFEYFYRHSEPYGGNTDGNTRLIQGERDACSCLADFVKQSLVLTPEYTVHVEYQVGVGQQRCDLAVIEWDRSLPVSASARKPICFIELKYLLGGNHENYSIDAIKRDCAKLTDYPVSIRFMCVINKKKSSEEDTIKNLEKEFPAVRVFLFSA